MAKSKALTASAVKGLKNAHISALLTTFVVEEKASLCGAGLVGDEADVGGA